MTILEIILLILNIVLASLYITSKLKDNKNLASIVKEVKEDIKLSSEAKNHQRVYHDCRRKESTS
jgi:regulatory protein YycI of two-component signal transduction system YycFG